MQTTQKPLGTFANFLFHVSGGSRISRWGGADPLGGCQPPMHTLFGENVCENERN